MIEWWEPGQIKAWSFKLSGSIISSQARIPHKRHHATFVTPEIQATASFAEWVYCEEIGGGNGWIKLGTTTRSLPKTNIAPALFAVPIQIIKCQNLEGRIICGGKWHVEASNKYDSSL